MTIQFAPRWTDATTTQTCVVGNATDIASAANSTLLDLQVNNVSKFAVDKFGELIIAPTARTSGSDALINLVAPADTTRAAGVEATDINFNLARTVQFAAGNITNQRAVRIQAPTYSFASASTITTAATLSISGPPTAGTNATLTNAWALNVESGRSYFYSPIFMGDGVSPGAINLQSATYTYKLFNSWPDSLFIAENNRTLCRLFGGLNNQSGSYTAGWLMAPQMTLAWAASEPVIASSAGDVIIARDTSNTLAQRNATNSQTFRLYNTFTDASNHERLALQFGTFSSIRHAQIIAEAAGTGTANINLVLTPKGTGAFILGPPPDGTVTGGNARGANAVDLQTNRSSAIHVASGVNSVIGGGASNQASGTASVIGGGAGNQAIGDYGTVGGGLGCQANAIGATCGGGRANWVVTPYATVGGGFQNNTYSSYCVIGGGIYNENAGDYSGILSGNFCSTTKPYASITGGNQAFANRYGMRAQNAGIFSARGDCQLGELVLRGTTTTNTAVRLRPDAASERLTISSGQVCQYLLIITGVCNGGADVATYIRQVTIKNIGGTTSIVGTVNTIGTDNAAGTTLSVTADDINDDLAVEPVGVFGQTWRWQCVVYGGEIGHG